ncbi:hypothetical protein A2363_02430 [Candidatus Gottesmanbacteria bacterium RIFOXYB1_FULL_47_11]|uniref:DUF4446 domain-containing protein n=1 Tax=Candidatus Gottesmanbacteria bacterium RIFOXYB1_FULL_47_11 TaxID=1798401 RepID=A0A1F6BED5_9BACT|nr:MAG: hypothetical protein A2363_02430 [Candidatus Gottesmanbacteria bacterium RIFOXYB1_FULL_47_11]
MVFNGSIIFVVIILVWVLGLTAWVIWTVRRLKKVTSGEALEQILSTQKKLRGETDDLYKTLEEIKKDGRLHIQRVGLVRFNPFSDTGGSQSFTLALLDGHNNGLVMTSLYARTGHRWYVKEVTGGKGRELALSKEESSAVQKAKPFEGEHHA